MTWPITVHPLATIRHPLPVLASLLIALLMLIGCAATERTAGDDAATTPDDQSTLRVGVARTAPPMIFGEGDDIEGIEADFARKLGEALGRRIEFVPMFFPDLISELRAGRIDIIMAGLSVTPERQQVIAFAEPYFVNGQQALIRAEDAEKLGTTHAIKRESLRIGVERESTGAALVSNQLPAAQAVVFPTLERAVEALSDGRVDAVIHDSTSIRWYARQSRTPDIALSPVPGLLTEEPVAWAVQRSDTGLLNQLNSTLALWRSNGTVQRTLDHWLERE